MDNAVPAAGLVERQPGPGPYVGRAADAVGLDVVGTTPSEAAEEWGSVGTMDESCG